MKKLLVIGKNWPEPNTTAAGYRMLQLLRIFQEDTYQIHFSSAATKSEYSEDLNSLQIIEKAIILNDSSFDDYLKELQPTIILYDRFMTEEQYGWRCREQVPQAIHILDTEDLHFLRKAREEAFNKKEPVHVFNETAMREIAAIYRCDLSIIISTVEMELLKRTFQLPDHKLIYVPFLFQALPNQKSHKRLPSFQERRHFIMIGNSLHHPNYDAILYMKKDIWPSIRKQLPGVEVHIYGAYQNEKITQLHNKEQGFIISGFATSAINTLKQYRILMAPLRFGAGLKGKIVDAMQSGTPVAMSSIASEGMFDGEKVFGFEENDTIAFISKCVELYTSKSEWIKISITNEQILKNNYGYTAFAKAFLNRIRSLKESHLAGECKDVFFIKMLNYHSNKEYKYLSKWIEEKKL
ncbi:glycosyltransferase [Nonlabens sp.]|uniref:glycosyltransferase n=1 Tax=Nonlabens sp. TaxID=1888209 RepID=UPI001BCF273E|nr:glycosyltransferase [Nonlabens sp.]